MNTSKAQAKRHVAYWPLPYFTTALGLFLAGMCLVEFYNVGVLQNTAHYPWGGQNDNPWYYQSPTVYAPYNLVTGLVMLTVVVLTSWAMVTRKRRLTIIAMLLTGACLLADSISVSIL